MLNNLAYSNRKKGMLKLNGLRRGTVWGIMIIGALIAFEIFNFSTTEFALRDILGNLNFFGIRWSIILSIAFCGIDFAGIARIFTPEQGADEPAEVWYLFAAWLLAAAMNATLTWWGISVAIANQVSQGSQVMNSATISTVVPVFVAIMVWLIRVLIIGTFSVAGDRLFSQMDRQEYRNTKQNTGVARKQPQPVRQPGFGNTPRPISRSAHSFNPAPKPQPVSRPEPTYQNINMGASASQQSRKPVSYESNTSGKTFSN